MRHVQEPSDSRPVGAISAKTPPSHPQGEAGRLSVGFIPRHPTRTPYPHPPRITPPVRSASQGRPGRRMDSFLGAAPDGLSPDGGSRGRILIPTGPPSGSGIRSMEA